ncbi:TIR-like protein FxsC [Kitasatospora phosalacinea]|uniref:TIR-like protein FxsC n=1 Tax=Kitasatospora phosalacinea TaxID=2065 RepID=UPI000689D564|nr:TIR-like protein FxsC [Kitasatospora phosalacinea]
MSSGAGQRKDAPRPYFFLSYAHTPRINSRGAADPNLWVAKLYQDLSEAILQITDAPSGHPVGFMDRSMHQGQKWAERLSRELATCRVFVPLYSPRYFKSEACGREWHLFSRRSVYQRRPTAERMTGIVPALWVAMEHYQLPRVAGELQFNHDSFGAEYATEGLYALMKIAAFSSEYHTAVWRLARRIVDVAEQTVIPIGQVLDFESQPSAFDPPDNADQVRISVFSYRERELPPQRSAFWYGEQRTDWQPYRPDSSRPLAQDGAGWTGATSVRSPSSSPGTARTSRAATTSGCSTSSATTCCPSAAAPGSGPACATRAPPGPPAASRSSAARWSAP